MAKRTRDTTPRVQVGVKGYLVKHGQSGGVSSRSPTYGTWANMLQRCLNPKNPRWSDYGGRGIKVCEQWVTFATFLADMGERPEGKTLDRKSPDGNYEPGNCRWATPLEQRANWRAKRASLIEVSQCRG